MIKNDCLRQEIEQAKRGCFSRKQYTKQELLELRQKAALIFEDYENDLRQRAEEDAEERRFEYFMHRRH